MVQEESRPGSFFPNWVSPDIAGMGKKNLETLAALQKEFLDALNKANQAWIAYLNEETALTSNFTKKMTATRSVPDVTAAYQEWVSQQIELLSKQARKGVEETQEFARACTEIMGDGKG
jgi:hypothetical protein